MRSFSNRITFCDHPTYLTEGNITTLVQEGDTVFLCVDNNKTRKLVSDRMEELDDGILISGANDFTDAIVQVHFRKNGVNVTLPLANKYHPELLTPEEQPIGRPEAAFAHPQLLITNLAVASTMLNAFYGVILKGENLGYSEVYLDILTNRARTHHHRAEGTVFSP